MPKSDSTSPLHGLLLADGLSIEQIVNVMREIREPDEILASIASKIAPEANKYLDRMHIESIVRADTTRFQALQEISKQRAFFGRLANLLPALLRHYKFSNEKVYLALCASLMIAITTSRS